jgi:hypothetical protein
LHRYRARNVSTNRACAGIEETRWPGKSCGVRHDGPMPHCNDTRYDCILRPQAGSRLASSARVPCMAGTQKFLAKNLGYGPSRHVEIMDPDAV